MRRGGRRPNIHVVRRGDTLYALAQRLGTDVQTLAQINGLKAGDSPARGTEAADRRRKLLARQRRFGQRPIGRRQVQPRHGDAASSDGGRRMTYTVRRGDTLYGIARLLQVTVNELMGWNGMSGERSLKPGQTLVAFVRRAAAGSRRAETLMGILAGKRALIVGVATDRSIAWGIAQAMHAQGAELAFSYANDKFKERVEPLAASIGSKLIMPIDVQLDDQIDAAFALLTREWARLDILVHAVAFAPREALAGGFTANTSREAFRIAHDVSSYSLTALARGAAPLDERARRRDR